MVAVLVLLLALLALLAGYACCGTLPVPLPWPLGWRYDADLPVSPYVWRKLAMASACTLVGMALLWRAWRWRRRRGLALVVAAALLAAAPWPRPALYLAPAYPTSFERSPLPFTPAMLNAGGLRYQARCAACHGARADGRGPRAAELPTWPGTLGQALFQSRLEGEIYWGILHHPLAPGSDIDPQAWDDAPGAIWQIVDYLRAQAYGATGGAGMPAVAAPDIAVSCRVRGRTTLRALRGFPLRIIAHGPDTARDERDDPRVTTVIVTRGEALDGECISADAAAWDAYAIVAGVAPDALAGAQFLVDRQGWLRARHLGGATPAWTSADNVCGPSGRLHVALAVQGLDQILKAMDAAPIAADRYRSGA